MAFAPFDAGRLDGGQVHRRRRIVSDIEVRPIYMDYLQSMTGIRDQKKRGEALDLTPSDIAGHLDWGVGAPASALYSVKAVSF